MPKYDVIIVGAGHNGMSAAHYLAKAGLRTLMLEMRHITGGVVATEEIFPGFFGNVATNAAHSFDRNIMQDMNLDKHGLRFHTAEPSSVTLFTGGRRIVGWMDREARHKEIAAFSAPDADAYFSLMDDINELATVLDVSYFEPPPSLGELTARLKTKKQEQLFAKLVFGSSADFVSEYFSSPEMLASVGLIPVGGSISGPFTAGSAYLLLHRALDRGFRNVRAHNEPGVNMPAWAAWNKSVPLGGMGAVTQAMERSVISSGVEIRTNTKVSHVKCDKGFVEGVVLDNGEEIHSRIVVSNLHPAATLLNLVPASSFSSEYRDRVKASIVDGCMSKIYLALDGEPRFACARDESENKVLQVAGFRTTAMTLSEARTAAEAAANGVCYEHPIITGVICSAADSSMAPPGKHIMSLSVSGSPFSLKGADWKSEQDRWCKRVINELSEFIPNIKNLIIDYASRTPADLEADFGLFRGEITHGKITAGRLLGWDAIEGRRDHVTSIPGLYLCGVGTWPGNYCSAIPGRNAAMRIISDLKKEINLNPRKITEFVEGL